MGESYPTNARLAAMLRQVLELIATAPKEWTTIPDDQGDFIGHDVFVGTELIDDAAALLKEWDEEESLARHTKDADQARAGAETEGGGHG